MRSSRSESGQIVILLALLIVGLLGFAALAIDGGNVYAERRQAQNVADSAALAAALASLEGRDYQTAALDQAAQFGYVNGADVQVEVYHPPLSGKYAPPYYESYKYFQVFVHVTSRPIFAHLIFSGMLKNSVEAVALAQPDEPPFPGDALVATSADTCGALTFDGGGHKVVQNGNVFSNSARNGSPTSCVSAVQNGGGDVTVYGGTVRTVGTLRVTGSGTVETIPAQPVYQGVQSQGIPYYPVPSCDLARAGGSKSVGASDSLAEPGWYPGGINVKSNLTLNPGVYCLGGDLKITGGNSLSGNGVFIIMVSGSVDTTGGTLVNLSASPDPWNLGGEAASWANMLIYVYPANTGVIDLGGGNTSSYTGTIYATSPSPNESQPKCDIGGATKAGDKLTVTGQVICYTITVHGNADIDVTYDTSRVSNNPRNITLVK